METILENQQYISAIHIDISRQTIWKNWCPCHGVTKPNCKKLVTGFRIFEINGEMAKVPWIKVMIGGHTDEMAIPVVWQCMPLSICRLEYEDWNIK